VLHLLGMGYANPTTVITNEFLEELGTGTTAAWIREKIGIETRLSALPLDYIKQTRNVDPREALRVATTNPSELGAAAARMALDRAGVKAEQVGLIIGNCCTPAQTTPSEAQRIGKLLGLKQVRAYDVFTACPAFALHLDILNNFKEESLPEYILGVSTAALTLKVNYNDRTDGAIWGDGAAAYLLSTRHPGKLKLLYADYIADPSRCDAVIVDTLGHFHQDGKAVRSFSVLQTVKMIRQMEAMFSIDWQRDIFIGHQANYTMLKQIVDNREIPDSNHWHNVVNVGNQAGAGAPASLAMNWNNIQPGQKIVVAVVGAGLSWGSALLEGV
jgi:3-oxoacyl-[acyl-carrier-protein] synthase-3